MDPLFCFPYFSSLEIKKNLPKKFRSFSFSRNSKKKNLDFYSINKIQIKENSKIKIESKNDQVFFFRFQIYKNFKQMNVINETITVVKKTKLEKILRNFNHIEISTEFPSMKNFVIFSIKNIQEISFLFFKFSKFFPKNFNHLLLFKSLGEEHKILTDLKETFFFSKNLIYTSNFPTQKKNLILNEENFNICIFENFNDYSTFIEIFLILNRGEKSYPNTIAKRRRFYFKNVFIQKNFVNSSKYDISKILLKNKSLEILFIGKRWIEKKEKNFFLSIKNDADSSIPLRKEKSKKYLILCSGLKIERKKNNFFFKIKNNLIKEHFNKFQKHPFFDFKIGGEWNFSKIDSLANFFNFNQFKKKPIKNLIITNQPKEIKAEMNLMVNYKERKIRSIFSLGKNNVIKNCNILFLFEKIPNSQFFKVSIGLNESFKLGKKKIFFFLRNESLKFFYSPSDFPLDFKHLTSNFYYQNFPICIHVDFFNENNYPVFYIDPFLINIEEEEKKKILRFSLDLYKKTQNIKIKSKVKNKFAYYLALNLFQFVFLDFKTKKFFKTKTKKLLNFFYYIFLFDENIFLKKKILGQISTSKFVKNFLKIKNF